MKLKILDLRMFDAWKKFPNNIIPFMVVGIMLMNPMGLNPLTKITN